MRSRSSRITIWGLWRKSEKEGGKEGEKEGGKEGGVYKQVESESE